jgi:hypothetical protein
MFSTEQSQLTARPEQCTPHFDAVVVNKEKAVRASTERLISATAGSRSVPSLNFGEVRESLGNFANLSSSGG